jgi:hypothetical protein
MASDELNRRLEAARPACVDEVARDAFDGALLARARAQGHVVERSRAFAGRRVAVPVAAAGVTFAAAGVVMFAGGPSDVGGPSSAEAISQQTLRWLDPPAGTVLHVRSVESGGGVATTREFWQSADHPEQQRRVVDGPGDKDYEMSGDVLYDPSSNTVYDVPVPPADGGGKTVAGRQDAKKADVLKAKAGGPAKGATPAAPQKAGDAGKGPDAVAGDPVVTKVRMLLQDGRMDVAGREAHNGVDTWKVTLTETGGRQPWTLWVDASDGKPVELVDPADGDQTIRWSAYDVEPSDAASRAALDVRTAHPDATVSHDAEAAAAARNRLVSSSDG